MREDVLATIRGEMEASRPEERGGLLQRLGNLHVDTGGNPARVDVEAFTDLAIELLGQASLFERMAFANVVADIGRVTTRLLEALLRDVYLVSRPLIERARLSDADLLAVIDGDGNESTLVAIAQRKGAGLPVTDRLIETAIPKVLLALAANDGAKISPAGFERFGAMAVNQREMDMALAQRSDLPLSIAKALHQRVSERSQKRVDEIITRDKLRKRRPLALGF